MNEILGFWAQWLRPSAGLPTVQWALLLALAAISGHVMQRHTGLPKVVGYSVVGTMAGLAGFSGALWPLQGTGLFLLELCLAIVLFEAGGHLSLRWFRHNPMIVVQSMAESALTYVAVSQVLHWLDVPNAAIGPLALVAMAASPAVLTRVVSDMRAAGPVTERALALTTLSTLYALTLGSASAELLNRPAQSWWQTISPVVVVLGVSVVSATVLAVVMRAALRLMSPGSEGASLLLVTLIAAASTIASHLGGSAVLAALVGGMMLKHLYPHPWAWHKQLGLLMSLLSMLMFVLVSTVAAQASWSSAVAGAVLALLCARLAAKALGVGLGHVGSGASWQQALWLGCAMTPLSAVALLIASQFVVASPATGYVIARVALPAILLMEVLGAVLTTLALERAGESSQPQTLLARWRVRRAPAAQSRTEHERS